MHPDPFDDATWRRSRRCTAANGNCVEVAAVPADAPWRKSSRSNTNGNCVEVTARATLVGVRDSKDPASGVLAVCAEGWQRFLDDIRSGHHDPV